MENVTGNAPREGGTTGPALHGGVVAGVVLALGIVAVLGLLSVKIVEELTDHAATSRDNVHWSLAQQEVEYLTLHQTILAALHAPSPDLGVLRRRFDIFYGRARMLTRGQMFDELAAEPANVDVLKGLNGAIAALVPRFDADDAALAAALPELEREVGQMRPLVRAFALTGVRHFAAVEDQRRTAFRKLLLATSLFAVVLLLILAALLVFSIRQNRELSRRGEALRIVSDRYAKAIDASLDAVIVADTEGRIVEFSPAAERTFGYRRADVLGQDVGELVVPPEGREAHRTAMARHGRIGSGTIIDRGRVLVEAMRADGGTFPAELSLATSDGPTGPMVVGYVRDITNRLASQRALTEARDKALAVAKAKSDFLAVMSHEMRTPLNGVLALLDLLGGTALDAKQREYLETATLSGEMLQRRVDDVLDITRIEAGRMRLRAAPFDVADLLQQVARVNTPAAEARGTRIKVRCDLAETAAVGDGERIAQVLLNLVANAVSFTAAGEITLDAQAGEGAGEVVFAVSDTGIGIAEDDRERIFEDFVTLDPSYSRAHSGYGLGLAICRRVVRALGGDIALESTPGVGSRFSFRIPLAFDAGAAALPSAAPSIAPLTEELRVLVVEDNETNRFAVREMLLHEGCEVVEAVDGLEGVEAAARERFDLILMDISMPRLDGIEATRRILGGDGLSRAAPVVGLTAQALPAEQERLREAGMVDCLIKPLRVHALRTLLAQLTGRDTALPPSDGSWLDGAVDPAIIDMSVLGELAELLPAAMLCDRLGTFRDELAALGPTLALPAARGDLPHVADIAHKTCGSAALFGAVQVQDILATLEEACREGEAEFVAPLIDELAVAVGATTEALNSLHEELTTSAPRLCASASRSR
ncbi:hybrid sensor histidine kinase/response regulator [Acuticoccus mangrovi]|uniref:histidine kinase n=1 Tax=Acuticoccus mangrovi TaxID=2796142 RepID=A0A934MF81_9HYPH|nr:ATP-binding protein [Acuticoccus mangrovi]MBJ3778377.1 response regulator [Acuticoccus mangrovi]